MAKFAVIVEQAADGGWGAYTDVCGSIIGGLGESRELAIADWKEAMGYWLNYRREKGEAVVIPDVELVTVEVAG